MPTLKDQTVLINKELNGHSAADVTAKATFNDPAFASNKTLPIHRWVPWIAGFSSDFVQGALQKYLSEPSVVLDPFAGVGTTLVEAVKEGHEAIGFEINPYAALASRVKGSAQELDTQVLEDETLRFTHFYTERANSSYQPITCPPAGFKTRADFYSPAVLRKVLILQDFIETIESEAIRDVFRLAFASTMVSYSNYSYEPSLARRVSSGKSEIHDFPVANALIEKISQIVQDSRSISLIARGHSKVINESFFAWESYLQPSSVDLLITSPPYLNNYHYNRNTRPHLYWLGFAQNPSDFKGLEEANFGKYWQTVRDRKPIGLVFSLSDNDLSQRLEAMREIGVERGNYGGSGWANYAASYFNDCARFARATASVLRPGGTALVVIGNSILQGIQIATDRYLSQIAAINGLECVEIHIPRATRIGSSIIQSQVRVAKAKDSHRLYEAVVELRKPF
jgi:DNA modification methylase